VTAPSQAVFLSYASEDQEAAQRICAALRAGGIEVWFDQNELRGGDVWDRQIRERIRDCRLFIALISAHTEARDEGYFRHEWQLAVERTHHMSDKKPFLVPIVIDDTRERGASVPDKLHEVQWTRLPGGETPPEFVERVRRLVSPEPHAPAATGLPAGAAPAPPQVMREPVPAFRRSTWVLPAIAAALIAGAAVYFAVDGFWISKHPTAEPATQAARASVAPTAFSPPSHSIAVLPFADMSEKHDQEYFADGLAEELLDLLAKTPGLQVIARTSSFSFKGKSDDIPTIAAKLKVGNVLEGSVRKSGNTLRVSTQLVRAANGEHIWSETYDREMKDLFKVQDDIANEVVQALKVKLAVTPAAERAPTDNMAAHNLLLEGRFFADRWAPGDSERAIASFEQALKEDPNYALAWAELSWAEMWAWQELGRRAGTYESATSAAKRAIELRPDLAQAHATRGWCESLLGFNWVVADTEFSKALALDPQNFRALYGKGRLARVLRRTDESLHYYQVVLERDPVNAFTMQGLASTFLALGKSADAVRTARKAFELNPSMGWNHWYLGYALLWNGELEAALREMQLEPTKSLSLSGIALIEQARGNPRAADAALRDLLAIDEVAKPYFVAEVYGARGDSRTAIAWLERARLARVGFFGEVATDPAFNPIRGDSAFVAYLHRMNLPG
jgi:TolB-like protein/Flp pilus assembly protein TadD